MAPSSTQQVLLSPAELSYLYTSLSQTPPIRPDARTSSQFRPLIAESDILPGTNGSARICFADGSEAIVGIKAEVEKSRSSYHAVNEASIAEDDEDGDEETRRSDNEDAAKRGLNEWVDLTVEIPGFRDDDSMPVFLAAMLTEALLADGEFTRSLWINRRFHWKLYLDVSYIRGLQGLNADPNRFYCSHNLYHILCLYFPSLPT
jgi:exosome complex component RRP42